MNEDQQTQGKASPAYKLKDHGNRRGVKFHLKEVFGFIPDEVIVMKVQGRNNAFQLFAIFPEKMLAKMKADQEAKLKDIVSKLKKGQVPKGVKFEKQIKIQTKKKGGEAEK